MKEPGSGDRINKLRKQGAGWFPISVDLRGRLCVVVGGGKVAERKVEALLAHGADVRVIGPRVTPRIASLGEAGLIRLKLREYRPGDLAGAFLALGATGRKKVNHRLHEEARREGVLLNAADDPAACDFIVPAVLRRGDLTIAVSTGGGSPALARRLRERLEGEIGEEYAAWLEILGRVREEALRRLPAGRERGAFLLKLAGDPTYPALLREGRAEEVLRRVREALSAADFEKPDRSAE